MESSFSSKCVISFLGQPHEDMGRADLLKQNWALLESDKRQQTKTHIHQSNYYLLAFYLERFCLFKHPLSL